MKDPYKDIYQILEDHFENPKRDVKVCGDEVSNALSPKVGKEALKEHRESIRNAITDYFTKKGFKSYIFFRGERYSIKLKLFNFDDNIYTDRLLRKFPDISQKVRPSKDKEGVFNIDEKSVFALLKEIDDVKETELQKECLRGFIKKALELEKRDAIFFINNQIIIKKFNEAEVGKARRMFDSISKDELETVYDKALSEGFEEKFQAACESLVTKELDISKLDTIAFSKSYLKVLQELFVKLLPSSAKSSDPVTMQGYANYMLRKNFDQSLYLIARKILDMFLYKDVNAERFIKFYNGDVSFSPDGKRFQKPDIIDETGARWNASTIFQVMMQRKKGVDKIRAHKESMHKTQQSIEMLESQITAMERDIEKGERIVEKNKKDFKNFVDATKDEKERITHLKDVIKKEKDAKAKQELQEEINKLSLDIKKSAREEERLISEKRTLDTEVERLHIKIKTLNKDIKAHKSKLNRDHPHLNTLYEQQKPLDEKYEHAIRAFAKAISSFRGY